VSTRFSQLMAYVDQRKALTTGDQARSLTHPEVVTLDTLIAMTHRSLTSAVRGYIQGLEEREQQLMTVERAGASNVAALSPAPQVELEAQRLIQQVAMLSRQAEQLRAERQATQIADAIEVGQIQLIDDARPPTSPLSTNTRRA